MSKSFNFSGACAIELEDKVVVTGGGYDVYGDYYIYYFNTENIVTSKVSVYNIGGWVEDLPDLNTGRYNHGCGNYWDNSNIVILLQYLD